MQPIRYIRHFDNPTVHQSLPVDIFNIDKPTYGSSISPAQPIYSTFRQLDGSLYSPDSRPVVIFDILTTRRLIDQSRPVDIFDIEYPTFHPSRPVDIFDIDKPTSRYIENPMYGSLVPPCRYIRHIDNPTFHQSSPFDIFDILITRRFISPAQSIYSTSTNRSVDISKTRCSLRFTSPARSI